MKPKAMKLDRQLARSQEIATKVSILFTKRAKVAQEHFAQQLGCK